MKMRMTQHRRLINLILATIACMGFAGGAVASQAESETVSEAADTVVLLHGLGRTSRNMLILKWRLQARGYRVCNVDYDTRRVSFDEVVDSVHQAVRICVPIDAQIHFVTHSLGGLVLRGLLARHEIPSMGRAVMLAPPNRGSEIADRFRLIGFANSVLGPLAGQLGTRREDLPRKLPAPSIPFGVIAGNQWINPAGPIWLPAPHDGTVSVESTRLEGMDDHIVLPHTHTFIVNAAGVADQVDRFLQQGHFLHATN
jgi:triacylglycerol lipase